MKYWTWAAEIDPGLGSDFPVLYLVEVEDDGAIPSGVPLYAHKDRARRALGSRSITRSEFGPGLEPDRFSGRRLAMKFRVVLTEDEAGGFVVECPMIPGCISQGTDREEALTNIREAILLCMETGEVEKSEVEIEVVP